MIRHLQKQSVIASGGSLSCSIHSAVKIGTLQALLFGEELQQDCQQESSTQFERVQRRNCGLPGIFRNYYQDYCHVEKIQQRQQVGWISQQQQPKKDYEKYYPKEEEVRRVQWTEEGDDQDPDEDNNKPYSSTELSFNNPWVYVVAVLTYMLYQTSFATETIPAKEIDFQTFRNELLATNQVSKIKIVNKNKVNVFLRPRAKSKKGAPQRYYFHIGSLSAFERKLEESQRQLGKKSTEFIPVDYTHEVSILSDIQTHATTLMVIAGWLFLTQLQMRGGGGMGHGRQGKSILKLGKAQVASYTKNSKNKVCFKDVAGCDEAKTEIMEFVNFLQNPSKYGNIGARIPKGALLVGPPGTGKTLLAKATAGEAGVPFFSISGSDFMEMYVGVGPARVRDLFSQARAKSPSIIFIDEIDAIGRARGGQTGFAGGNEERENTLNQLLVEMDGFQTSSGVVVLAGTNRPDVLDKALLRPGRFDRQISLDRPDVNGREQIFKVHLSQIKLNKPIKFYSERLAALTPGFAGADIANVVNEAALIAARKNKNSVEISDFEGAVDRIIGGMEKQNHVVSDEERRRVAYHEAGHVVAGWFLEHAEPLMKVSIVPRGSSALGFTQYLPNENVLMTTDQMADMMCMTLGGRAAEEVVLGSISSGAQNDLEKITKIAYKQVSLFGMNKSLGHISYPQSENQIDKPYSRETANFIDSEVRNMIESSYARTRQIIESKKEVVMEIAETLLKKDTLSTDELEEILGPRPFQPTALRNIDKFRDGFLQNDNDVMEDQQQQQQQLQPNKISYRKVGK
eukprot:TRINITY_DN6086_c0_g1_i3.p1 TRINITY_DN6086_c0_g1~~TRINITY_DN6086_c0_g1_i3.p1  ORF type:complete len:797 (-),score=139.82 TRINITY_DN6086_c0_g1_i3:767-3157(-)